MKILSIKVQNFASYEDLRLSFDNQGLTLIHGPTGSGKSTLCDIIPWVLFGRTAKGGMADEVLAWGTVNPTFGRIELITDKNETIFIERTRGKAKDNDLCFGSPQGELNTRGKDLPDTQKLINERLGMTYDTYLTCAYYYEYSQSGQFFNTTAKNRRQFIDQLVDMRFPNKIQSRLKELQKTTNSTEDTVSRRIQILKNVIQSLQAKQKSDAEAEISRLGIMNASLLESVKNFNDIKERRDFLKQQSIGLSKNKCRHCGGPLKSDTLTRIQDEIRNLDTDLDRMYKSGETLESNNRRIASLRNSSPESLDEDINTKQRELSNLEEGYEKVLEDKTDQTLLGNALDTMRSNLLINTVGSLEEQTNNLLAEYFDAEIKISLTIAGGDELHTQVFKSGSLCSFTQLSKGQRCILKLCFGIAAQEKASQEHGLRFNTVFFDEALDGMDDSMKIKAYRLFESLEHENIFIVDHSEAFKSLFSNQISVRLSNGFSNLDE